MSKRGDAMLIDDMLDSSEQILKYTDSMTFEQFLANRMVIDAVIRNFEIIGEAANKLSDDFKEANSQIDWHRIRGFRNRIVHDYSGIDYSLVWEIRTNCYLTLSFFWGTAEGTSYNRVDGLTACKR